MNAPETIARLVLEGAFCHRRLIRWPDWLNWADLQACVAMGLLERRSYGPATYGHTDYFLPLCCWCDDPATGAPVQYAGTDHPACPAHSAEYHHPINYTNEDFDRINHAKRLPPAKRITDLV